ncbi:unnamed protein product [Rotaria magnacalcarata]|uniref:BZIP domain-containing protein n=1 Tax=Rotaria magnacalcarata TaxID=392030 RepID=A0A815Y5S1_9BILA|nr:unnamed protein product [Rotaria magnacalcarata]CAF2092850.1 unnamed protein product [Rotaria magnacalcarata]CAF4002662.1 unnamed protein product [Rotaria magnacalcarata]
MQADEGEFDLTSSFLETPSLMTPNIVLNAQPIKSVFITTPVRVANGNDISSTSNPSSILSTSSETSSCLSSADAKVSRIQDELKQSFNETRQPTPSPFQKMSSTPVSNFDKPILPNANDDAASMKVPSTADVVTDLEALTNANPLQFQSKVLMNENQEYETMPSTSDNIRYDASPTVNLGINVSPKKQFLIRSQSHTEPASAMQNNNHLSQSQKSNHDNSMLNTQNDLDDENSMDDSIGNDFTRVSDLPIITHSMDINNDNNNQQLQSAIDSGHEQYHNMQLKIERNMIHHEAAKQQNLVSNHINNNNNNSNNNNNNNNTKRSFQQTNTGNTMPTLSKTNTIIMTQSTLNEVTSTDQLSNVKRQRIASIPINATVMNFRPSFTAASTSGVIPTNTLTSNTITNGGSDDQRKKQIRDSNREAARRCRERRRQYIEQLEGNLEQYKTQIKQLSDKLARLERENTQLRAILSETKIVHQGSRISANEAHIDYANVMVTTGMDINSESNHQMDGRTIQRSYIDRNNL